jgi:hypothetical protein
MYKGSSHCTFARRRLAEVRGKRTRWTRLFSTLWLVVAMRDSWHVFATVILSISRGWEYPKGICVPYTDILTNVRYPVRASDGVVHILHGNIFFSFIVPSTYKD